jgi:putative aminopeptidase FrvX
MLGFNRKKDSSKTRNAETTTGFGAADLIIQKTINYLDIPCVVGHEYGFMNLLEQEYKALGVDVERWDQGLVVSGTKPWSQIISAHIDRHGLISIGYGEYAYAGQYVREVKYGQNDRSSQKALERIKDRFLGEHVYAYHPMTLSHLDDGVIVACDPKSERNGDSIFQIENMRDMPHNTPIAYSRNGRYHNGFLKGQIDNAVCVATVYALFKNGFQGTAILTTEEEIGKSWSHIQDILTEHAIQSQELIILDTSPYKEHRFVKDGYVVLRMRDKSAIFNVELAEKLAKICNKLDIPFHFKDQYFLSQGKETEDLGSTELGRLIMGTAGQWSGASIQLPTLEYHTSYETTTRRAIVNFYRVLDHLLVRGRL